MPSDTNRIPRQKADCEKYSLPQLFGEISVKNYFLPLGFQSSLNQIYSVDVISLNVQSLMINNGCDSKAVGIHSMSAVWLEESRVTFVKYI